MDDSTRKLSKGEKWSLAILGAATLGIVFLITWQMKETIYAPFEKNPTGEAREKLDPNRDLAELRNRDTDQDGLNDFDELYVHGTSPYLPDSDSDGITDAAEISAGKDPNCPEGEDCYLLQGETGDEMADLGEELDLTEAEKAALILELPASELRELLLGAGVPAETLNELSDEELKAMVGDILQEKYNISGAGSAASTSTPE